MYNGQTWPVPRALVGICLMRWQWLWVGPENTGYKTTVRPTCCRDLSLAQWRQAKGATKLELEVSSQSPNFLSRPQSDFLLPSLPIATHPQIDHSFPIAPPDGLYSSYVHAGLPHKPWTLLTMPSIACDIQQVSNKCWLVEDNYCSPLSSPGRPFWNFVMDCTGAQGKIFWNWAVVCLKVAGTDLLRGCENWALSLAPQGKIWGPFAQAASSYLRSPETILLSSSPWQPQLSCPHPAPQHLPLSLPALSLRFNRVTWRSRKLPCRTWPFILGCVQKENIESTHKIYRRLCLERFCDGNLKPRTKQTTTKKKPHL